MLGLTGKQIAGVALISAVVWAALMAIELRVKVPGVDPAFGASS